MQSVLIRLFSIFIFIFISNNLFGNEILLYKKIVKTYNENPQKAKSLIKSFYKKYPKSNFVPDIKLMLIEKNDNYYYSIENLKKLLKYYKYFKKRDIVYLYLCQLFYLKKNWDDMYIYSLNAINDCQNSKYLSTFYEFHVLSCILKQNFDMAYIFLNKLKHIKQYDHNLKLKSSFIKCEIDKNIYGYSKSYLKDIANIIYNHKNSNVLPSTMIYLANYYEKKHLYNHAWSTYHYIIKHYPLSPEARIAKGKIKTLNNFNPVYVKFYPDKSLIDNADSLDISPEIDLNNKVSTNKFNLYYTIDIGPLYNLNKAKEIKNIIRKTADFVYIIKYNKSFHIFAGKFENYQYGVALKIRLAEEYGINGNLKEFYEKDGKIFVHE